MWEQTFKLSNYTGIHVELTWQYRWEYVLRNMGHRISKFGMAYFGPSKEVTGQQVITGKHVTVKMPL